MYKFIQPFNGGSADLHGRLTVEPRVITEGVEDWVNVDVGSKQVKDGGHVIYDGTLKQPVKVYYKNSGGNQRYLLYTHEVGSAVEVYDSRGSKNLANMPNAIHLPKIPTSITGGRRRNLTSKKAYRKKRASRNRRHSRKN